MSVTVEVTYEMSKALGVQRFEVEGAGTVADAVSLARERFHDAAGAGVGALQGGRHPHCHGFFGDSHPGQRPAVCPRNAGQAHHQQPPLPSCRFQQSPTVFGF